MVAGSYREGLEGIFDVPQTHFAFWGSWGIICFARSS
jgi:hypothetical protein